jgi:hypothetical protein
VPHWISSSQASGSHWNADAARRDDTGRRFWAFVTTLPLVAWLAALRAFALFYQHRGQRSEDVVCLATDFLAVRRRVLRSVGSDPPFVACRLSTLRRAATAFIGELLCAVWLTVKGMNVARCQGKAAHSTASS